MHRFVRPASVEHRHQVAGWPALSYWRIKSDIKINKETAKSTPASELIPTAVDLSDVLVTSPLLASIESVASASVLLRTAMLSL